MAVCDAMGGLGDSFLELGGRAVTQWGGLGDSFLELGGRSVTQWGGLGDSFWGSEGGP